MKYIIVTLEQRHIVYKINSIKINFNLNTIFLLVDNLIIGNKSAVLGIYMQLNFYIPLMITVFICIQDTLPSRAALGLPAVQPLGRVRRASKGIWHTMFLLIEKRFEF